MNSKKVVIKEIFLQPEQLSKSNRAITLEVGKLCGLYWRLKLATKRDNERKWVVGVHLEFETRNLTTAQANLKVRLMNGKQKQALEFEKDYEISKDHGSVEIALIPFKTVMKRMRRFVRAGSIKLEVEVALENVQQLELSDAIGFVRFVEEGIFPKYIRLGWIDGGDCYLLIEVDENDKVTIRLDLDSDDVDFSPCITSLVRLVHKSAGKSHVVVKSLKLEDGSSKSFIQMPFDEIMNKGFLSDERVMTIEVQIRVDRRIHSDGDTFLNFATPLDYGFEFRSKWGKSLYVNKQLLIFHSPVFSKMMSRGVYSFNYDSMKLEYFMAILQHLHGRRDWIDNGNIFKVLPFAHRFQIRSIVLHCETILMNSIKLFGWDMCFQCAVEYDMRFLMKTLMNKEELENQHKIVSTASRSSITSDSLCPVAKPKNNGRRVLGILNGVKDLRADLFGSNQRPFAVHEVIDRGGEAVKCADYLGDGRYTNFNFGAAVSQAAKQQSDWKNLLRIREHRMNLNITDDFT
ncbi:unnamed protein product [Caenorhabditis sp. 36 PRJEB53466]|nr:unnamed protein product [Caenorhabditis sp. 36 PRJEB53466]